MSNNNNLKTLVKILRADIKKGINDCPFKILFKKQKVIFTFYILSVPIYLRSTLQNQTKRRGHEKDDFVYELG